jgi:hypothetical protein
MNSITKKEYNKIKNDTSYSVVSFKNNKRTLSYGGCNIIQAMDQVILRQSFGEECLIIKNLPIIEISKNRGDYNKYLVVEK